MKTAVEMHSISKRFGKTIANDKITLKVREGHIHAVLGENGAGKTTLMRILYGEEQADSGKIIIHGKKVDIESPAQAIEKGIGLIHQHFMLIEKYSIAENFALGNEPVKNFFFTDYRPVKEKAEDILHTLDIPLSLDVPVGNFSVEEKQIIEIGKALYRGAEILILDEPTSVLTPQKVNKLLDILRSLREEGKTIILITHKLEEALAVADEITVLRKGKHVGTLARSETNQDKLIRMMIGEEEVFEVDTERISQQDVLVRVEHLEVIRDGNPILNDVTFEVNKGEILGLTGVGGNGQVELAEALVGLLPVSKGHIFLAGHNVEHMSVRKRRKRGISYVPADRLQEGLALSLTVLDNLIMGHHFRPTFHKGIILLEENTRNSSRKWINEFNIKTESEKTRANHLSGGNLQKLIIAREFSFDAKFLIVAYPSQGIDIRTTSYVHSELLRRRKQGCAILLVSGDLEEILKLSDRIGVMYNGELVTMKEPKKTSRMELGKYMTGVLKDFK